MRTTRPVKVDRASPAEVFLSGSARATDLYRLLYYSDTAVGLERADIEDILRQAAERNARVGISGALAWDGMHFVQLLEGHRIAVADLLARLFRDPRHRNLVVCDMRRIRRRQFESWSMADLSGKGVFANFSGFQPYACTATELLRHLVLALDKVG